MGAFLAGLLYGEELAAHIEAGLRSLAPGATNRIIQEAHIALWHTLCGLIEAHCFPEMR